MFNVKCIYILCILFASPAFAVDFDLAKANEYMQKVDVSLGQDQKSYIKYKEMYSQLEKYNFQAEQCIQEETKKLNNISTLEQDTGLQGVDTNTEDVQYIAKKKKTHTWRLSQCRLYVFKSQDTMYELQDKINSLTESRSLTAKEKILEILTYERILTNSFVILAIFIGASVIAYMFLRNKIRSMHVVRVTRMYELRLLKYTLFILIGGWIAFLILEWLNWPSLLLQKTQNFLINGTSLYGINIVPLRLIVAIIVFCVLQIVGKYTAMRFANQAKFDDESETNIVIGSLLKYIVLAIAALVALLVAGVDFTGLAIVAGALSVGIGFGLQNIVNNFVSGLILLIEKPIRPGDRIMVKGIEGYVEEISIRSTRMVSFLKEEIIFPNSDIISNPITNYVLHTTASRLTIRVTVKYENNIKLVMQTLVDIASQHPDVLKDAANKPTAVLIELKENGMIFELGCVVKHVDKKYNVGSEINTMIVNVFKDKNIHMSYPQLEVHMAN